MGPAQRAAPLFKPQWTRAILATSLSSRSLSGPVNLDRAVELIARGETLRTLPRQPARSLARGVQVLFDIGENMQPFAQDRGTLRRDLRRIVGEGGLEVLNFVGSPRRARRDGNPRAWRDYWSDLLPQAGACVLAVTDFGAGEPAGLAHGSSPYAWRGFAESLRRRGHRVVAFVPYPPARWPQSLGRAISLVQWDRSTTVSQIRFARAGGLAR
jgi:hypothetical protein